MWSKFMNTSIKYKIIFLTVFVSSLAFIFSATLRFFPLLFSEIGNIIQAQRLRGLAMEKMNIIQRVSV